MDVSKLSFKTLLLLERVQLSWFPGWVPEDDLAQALKANPAVEWYMRHKCPEIENWLNWIMSRTPDPADQKTSRHHAMLQRQGVVYQISDLNSGNGTYVNGKRITEPTLLKNGDILQIGDTKLSINDRP